MITYLDLVQDEEFRDFVERRLSSGTNNPNYSLRRKNLNYISINHCHIMQ